VSRRRGGHRDSPHGIEMPARVAIREWDVTESEETIVLLHGATSSSRTWWRVGPTLSRLGYRVIAVDLPGHGDTQTAERPATPRTMAEQVLQSLVSRPFDVLVGHSLGSIVAIELLSLAPNAAQALILDEPPGPRTVQWGSAIDRLRAEQGIARRNPQFYASEVHRKLPGWNATDCATAVEDLIACDLDVVADAFTVLASGSSHALVPLLEIPALIMLGPDVDGDYIIGGAYGSSIRGEERRQLVDAFRSPTTCVFGVGHVLHRDAPEKWAHHVASFAEQSLRPD
jgi:pimeloyl-ACP methyl ester carboxylesterase